MFRRDVHADRDRLVLEPDTQRLLDTVGSSKFENFSFAPSTPILNILYTKFSSRGPTLVGVPVHRPDHRLRVALHDDDVQSARAHAHSVRARAVSHAPFGPIGNRAFQSGHGAAVRPGLPDRPGFARFFEFEIQKQVLAPSSSSQQTTGATGR